MLGFLGFGWVWSTKHFLKAYWVDHSRFGTISHQSGEWSLDAIAMVEDCSEPPMPLTWETVRHEESELSFPSACIFEFREMAWSLAVADWFLMLLFLIPWSAFLAWRWRRQRILTKAHDAAPAP